MGFELTQKVLFKHCDPAGIVFYPRYFEMMNDCVEAFFDTALQSPFETLHQQGAVPTAEISTRFTAPSRHGDLLRLVLQVTDVGRSSMHYVMRAYCQDALRFETTAVLVNVNDQGRPTPWDAPLKTKLQMQKDMHA